MKEVIIGENDAGQRLDKFLTKSFPNLPQSMLYKSVRKKNIKLNGKRAEISTMLQYNDTITLFLNDDLLMNNPSKFYGVNTHPEDLLDIVYEDEHILLINKKSGMQVHEGDERTRHGKASQTSAALRDNKKNDNSSFDNIAERLKAYLYAKGEYDPEVEQSFAPALCNRLDRNTSGILIAAKTAEALRVMNERIKARELEKHYLCITVGVPAPREAVMTAFHVKDSNTNTVKIYNRPIPGSKEIKTAYRVLRDNGTLALLDVNLLTGRTHQIRAHLAHIGCPILGDGKYGINKTNRAYHVKTQALCSYKLKFCFKTPAPPLDYLNGQEFVLDDVWFKDEFV
jgi:23S rRNA pseudouridine955/2504/2580 synthase